MTAEQYLAWVKYQADRLPDYTSIALSGVKAPINSKYQQSRTLPDIQAIDPCPSAEFEPTIEWESSLLYSFSELRSTLEKYSTNVKSRERLVTVPQLKDARSWMLFCLGEVMDEALNEEDDPDHSNHEELEEVDDGYEVDDEIDPDDNPDVVPVHESTGSVWSGPLNVTPTTSLLLQFDQVMTQRLLGYHINWLSSRSLDNPRAQWIYALLARIEKPIHRDLECEIRQLYRRCCRLRVELWNSTQSNTNVEEIAQVNTLIVITGIYFGQGEHERAIVSSVTEGTRGDIREDDITSLEEGEVPNEDDAIDDDGEEAVAGHKRDSLGHLKM